MVSLTDLAPSETMAVNGKKITATGISAKNFGILLNRFSVLKKLMERKEELTIEEIIANASEGMIEAIIASGVGQGNDEDAEEAAARLPMDVQIDLLSAVLRVTMPKGFGPFAEKWAKLGEVLNPPDPREALRAKVLRMQSARSSKDGAAEHTPPSGH